MRLSCGVAQAVRNVDLQTMPIKAAKTRWQDVVLVCRKCSKKLDDEGFGPDGDKSLKKALKKYLKAGKGRKAEITVRWTDCFDVCPKKAVVAVNAARPSEMLIVEPGTDLLEIKARLGVDDGRRLKLLPAPAAAE